MLGNKIKKENYQSRKEYLVALAIEYINETSEFVGAPEVFYDDAECDGASLASDLQEEFGI